MILSSIGIITSKAASAPSAGIVTDGLQCQLEASVYSGSGNWLDQSGNGKNFTPTNGVTFVSAGTLGINSYWSFDGSNDYFAGPASNSFNIGNDHTIEFGTQTANNDSNTILSFTGGTGSGNGYGIHICIPELDGGQQRIKYDVTSDYTGRMYYDDVSNQLFDINIGWQFRKFSDASPYRTITKSRQGFEQVNKTLSTPINIAQQLDGNAVLIGQNPGKGENFQGRLYYFRVYNRKLTDAELAQNWAVDKIKLGIS